MLYVVCCIIQKTTTNATGEVPTGIGRHLGGRPSGKAPDRRIGRVGPSLEWLQAGKNGQVGQDQADFMRAGTRIRPPSPGNRAFAGIIRLSCSLSPAGIRPASRRPQWSSGWPAVRMSCSARKPTSQNALQAFFPGVRGPGAGQGSENAVAGLLRSHFSPFKPSCPSRKASPLLFEDFLTFVDKDSVPRRAARPVERPARPKDAAGVIYPVS